MTSSEQALCHIPQSPWVLLMPLQIDINRSCAVCDATDIMYCNSFHDERTRMDHSRYCVVPNVVEGKFFNLQLLLTDDHVTALHKVRDKQAARQSSLELADVTSRSDPGKR
jgi:hypothetical protein